MNKTLSVLVAAVAICAAAGAAWGLVPDEVLVVANANSPDSVSLAKFYLQSRGIPETNLVLVKTTTDVDMSREEYNAQLVGPLRAAITDRKLNDKIKCLCLMWGVPVRVRGPAATSQELASEAIHAAAEKAHVRLAIDYALLASVGAEFPKPQTEGLTPLGKLFASPLPEPAKPLAKFEDLQRYVSTLIGAKRVQLSSIGDPAKKAIAARQLMALHLDIYGLSGLINYIEADKPPGSPVLDDLKRQLAEADGKLGALRKQLPTLENNKAKLELLEKSGGLILAYSFASDIKPAGPKSANCSAAVDNELALLWWDNYPLGDPDHLDNPLNWRIARTGKKFPPTLMAARIDGPTPDDAMRIIKASVAVEKTGLKGNCYIDAGGPDRAKDYDKHLSGKLGLYAFMKSKTKMKTVLEDTQALFPRDSCPESALYVGWYSLSHYVPSFMWSPGAVGWHIASFEAVHLHDPDSQEWCVKMIQNGVAATVGSVEEPYLGAFPLPEEFFPLLLTGQWTVAECYWRTNPWVSWRMTLIADPLYNPFHANPQVKVEDLREDFVPGGQLK